MACIKVHEHQGWKTGGEILGSCGRGRGRIRGRALGDLALRLVPDGGLSSKDELEDCGPTMVGVTELLSRIEKEPRSRPPRTGPKPSSTSAAGSPMKGVPVSLASNRPSTIWLLA